MKAEGGMMGGIKRIRPGVIKLGVAAGLALLVAACVTVNVYFPAAKVEKTAEKIVGEVYGQEGEGVKGPDEKAPDSSSGSWMGGFLAWLGPRPAMAQDATTVSNAAIRGLKAQIAQRHQQLVPFYDQGKVGIKPDGYLAVRSTAGLSVQQVAQLKRLVAADNAARSQLYKEVAAALNLNTQQQVGQVQGIFAKQWRAKAKPGWRIN